MSELNPFSPSVTDPELAEGRKGRDEDRDKGTWITSRTLSPTFSARHPIFMLQRGQSCDIKFFYHKDPRRHSQVAKAAVCKTVIHRFESGCRLHEYQGLRQTA